MEKIKLDPEPTLRLEMKTTGQQNRFEAAVDGALAGTAAYATAAPRKGPGVRRSPNPKGKSHEQ